MTLDELHEIYRGTRLAVIFEAKGEELVADVRERAERAGIAAVIRALRDEMQTHCYTHGEPECCGRGVPNYDNTAEECCSAPTMKVMDEIVIGMFNEILGDAGEKATTDAIQSNGEAQNGFRIGIERPEERRESDPHRLERKGDVPVPSSRFIVRSEPCAAEHIPRTRHDSKLQSTHRHEDSGRSVCPVGSVSERPAGGRLGHSDLNEKVAEYTGGMNDLSVTPATAPAPAVCVWTVSAASGLFSAKCQPHNAFVRPVENCHLCGLPIKFTEAKT